VPHNRTAAPLVRLLPAGLAGYIGHTPAGWTTRAACAETDPEAFYPAKGASTVAAKAVCTRCPVRGECLAEALERRERHGVWGGLSEPERRALLRRRRDAAADKRGRDDHDEQPPGGAGIGGPARRIGGPARRIGGPARRPRRARRLDRGPGAQAMSTPEHHDHEPFSGER